MQIQTDTKINQPITFFTQPAVLESIGSTRLNRFLHRFAGDLNAFGMDVPRPGVENPRYFLAVAALFADVRLPERLRHDLVALEAAASPSNQDRLDAIIAERIPDSTINPYCPLDRALELWFAAPEELQQFAPQMVGRVTPCAPPDSSSSSSSTVSVPLPLTAPPTLPYTPTLAFKVQSSEFDVRSSAADDSKTFSRLSRLGLAEYDHARRAEAKRLGLRIETLDAEVAKRRAELLRQPVFHSTLFPSLSPWPDPIDDQSGSDNGQSGSDLLSAISDRFALYLVLPPGAADAMALWTAHTHAFTAFHLTPRLSLYSPRPGCGKTTAFDVLATMIPRPLRTENLSPAVLFRLVDQHQPTLLLDEVDAYLPQSEELRGLLNAGHKRGACAYRCEGEGKAVRAFKAFAPAALAGIGSLPATLRDRSVLVPLTPAAEGQIACRFDPLRTETEQVLARKLARWAVDNLDALAACDPPLPPGAFNRLADNWRPLFAVAQIVGGDWPARALAAFLQLATPPPRPTLDFRHKTLDSSESVTLLEAIRQIFTQSGATRMSSQQLVESLAANPGLDHQLSTPQLPVPLQRRSTAALARQLAPFGIRARILRIENRRVRGYHLTDFDDILRHYVPRSELEAILAEHKTPGPENAPGQITPEPPPGNSLAA